MRTKSQTKLSIVFIYSICIYAGSHGSSIADTIHCPASVNLGKCTYDDKDQRFNFIDCNTISSKLNFAAQRQVYPDKAPRSGIISNTGSWVVAGKKVDDATLLYCRYDIPFNPPLTKPYYIPLIAEVYHQKCEKKKWGYGHTATFGFVCQ